MALGGSLSLKAARPVVSPRHQRTEREQHLIQAGVGALSALLLSGAIPILLLMDVPNAGRENGAWVGSFAILVASGIRLGVMIGAGDARLFEFIVWVFSYVFFGIGATVQLRSDMIATTTQWLNTQYDWPAVTAVGVGLIAFSVGVAVSRTHIGEAKAVTAPSTISLKRTNLLVFVGLIAAVFYVSQIGLSALTGNRDGLSAARSSQWADPTTSTIIHSLATYPLLVAVHAYSQARRTSGFDAKTNRVLKRRAIWSAVIVLSVVNPLSSARYAFGSVWGSLLAPLGAFANRWRTTWALLGIVGALLLIFPIADAFRSDTSSASRAGFFAEYAGNGDYDSIGQVSNAVAYVSSEGIAWGSQFLGVLFFWLPRSIWPGKPTDTGVLLAEFRGYGFTNLSAPLWAEAMVNFGWAGVIVGFVLLGVLVGKIDIAASAALLRGGFAALPASILPLYFIIILRGSLLQATGALVVMVACMLFVRQRPASTKRGFVRAEPASQ